MKDYQGYSSDGIEHIVLCDCGAVTVRHQLGEFCIHTDTFEKAFGSINDYEIERAPTDSGRWFNCNHCINHWGLDLCHCGSGEFSETGECSECSDS